MANIASILNQRFLKKDKSKTGLLAQKATDGALTSFSGIFSMQELSAEEKKRIEELLKKYAPDENMDIAGDLSLLVAISSEVKAITTQALMLHGQRLKKAQDILKKYRDGAFTSWLISTYGNRQTPYNFLQYYEFFSQMPTALHPQIEMMPRQAIYALASREGTQEKKEEIVRNYSGETKEELLSLIRARFPLSETDKRRENVAQTALQLLEKLNVSFQNSTIKLMKEEKTALLQLVRALEEKIRRA